MTNIFIYGEKELEHLRKKDKLLGKAIDRIGMIERKTNPDLFKALVESVISQQISGKAAATVQGKLAEISGLEPTTLNSMTIEEIRACGMSMRKAGYIKGIASAYADKNIDFAALCEKSDEDIIEALTALKGVGVWTAEMLLLFSLQRPNVVSFGDLAIRRGMMLLYGHKELPRERFDRYAKRYAPYGSVASLYLWEISVIDW